MLSYYEGSTARALTLALGLAVMATPVWGATPNVTQPAGLNTGFTSFYDGFPAAQPGQFAYLGYYRYSHANQLKDNSGNRIDAFNPMKLDVWVSNHQFLYTFAHSPFDNASLGLDLIIPIVGFDTHFGGPATLKANSGGVGDIFVGTYLQYHPTMSAQGDPLFVHRFEVGFNVPTGKYDASRDINPGANQWSFTPTWSATWLPEPRWTVNWRLQYLYNFKNDDPASSQPLTWKGGKVSDTRAGQLVWLNFASEYEVAPAWHVGINGYYLKQITDDKVNGDTLKDSREQVLGIGPGMMWGYSKTATLTLNLYTETDVRNRSRNAAIVNVLFVKAF